MLEIRNVVRTSVDKEGVIARTRDNRLRLPPSRGGRRASAPLWRVAETPPRLLILIVRRFHTVSPGATACMIFPFAITAGPAEVPRNAAALGEWPFSLGPARRAGRIDQVTTRLDQDGRNVRWPLVVDPCRRYLPILCNGNVPALERQQRTGRTTRNEGCETLVRHIKAIAPLREDLTSLSQRPIYNKLMLYGRGLIVHTLYEF